MLFIVLGWDNVQNKKVLEEGQCLAENKSLLMLKDVSHHGLNKICG